MDCVKPLRNDKVFYVQLNSLVREKIENTDSKRISGIDNKEGKRSKSSHSPV